MWIPGGIVYLIAGLVLGARWIELGQPQPVGGYAAGAVNSGGKPKRWPAFQASSRLP